MRKSSLEGKNDVSKRVRVDVGERNLEDPQYEGESSRWRLPKSRTRMIIDGQINEVDDGETSTKWGGDSQRKN